MNIQIVVGDITKQANVDAIVNAANKSLLGGGGVDGAIHRAAGSRLLSECRKLHGCNTGEAKITGAYNLPCKYVIHTVGPIYRGGYQNEALLLESAYRNCMKLALNRGIRTIAFPAISTGRYSYPLKEATKIALRTVMRFYNNNLDAFDLVRFVVFDSATKNVYDEVFQSLTKDFEYCRKEQKSSQKNKANSVNNISIVYNKEHRYRGIIYEVSEEQGAHPGVCTFCGKEMIRKALINVHGKTFITCEKCASNAIDLGLNLQNKDTNRSIKKDEKKVTVKKVTREKTNNVNYVNKYPSTKAYIDALIHATDAGDIKWTKESSWENNHEKTTFRSSIDNITIEMVQSPSDVQYILTDEKSRIVHSYIKTLVQSIQKSKKNGSNITHTGGKLLPNREPIEERIIRVRDFVVRRSVFKCMHNEHELKTIIGIVTVIDSKGREKQVEVNAGYCADCNIFFILESAYEKIRKQGIPLCRTCDEKNYAKQISANGMKLAPESILMQYGYNVNQQVGLTAKTRQKILAALIDYEIISKSEIISYLDFFIRQRESREKYKFAIAKWEEDREFVENYKIRNYQKYQINGIIRK